MSQSTIKMDKVSYSKVKTTTATLLTKSQSTIKMDKVSYLLITPKNNQQNGSRNPQ